ncbi:Uncharacterised protein [Bordetella pertussis]|nr:Uncharacterised protein [Bordetella pertussis]
MHAWRRWSGRRAWPSCTAGWPMASACRRGRARSAARPACCWAPACRFLRPCRNWA